MVGPLRPGPCSPTLVRNVFIKAQVEGLPLEFVAPSGRVSRFSKDEVAGRVSKGHRRAKGPDRVWPSVLSAMFRAVEGDLMDGVLARFHDARNEHGGRLVLPLYDGLLVAAPVGREDAVWTALQSAGNSAAGELGIPTRLVRKR